MSFVQYQSEGEQLQSFTSKTSKESISLNIEKDELLKSNVSKITVVHPQKDGKSIIGKEKNKLSSSLLKKSQPKKSPPLAREIRNKVRIFTNLNVMFCVHSRSLEKTYAEFFLQFT